MCVQVILNNYLVSENNNTITRVHNIKWMYLNGINVTIGQVPSHRDNNVRSTGTRSSEYGLER